MTVISPLCYIVASGVAKKKEPLQPTEVTDRVVYKKTAKNFRDHITFYIKNFAR